MELAIGELYRSVWFLALCGIIFWGKWFLSSEVILLHDPVSGNFVHDKCETCSDMSNGGWAKSEIPPLTISTHIFFMYFEIGTCQVSFRYVIMLYDASYVDVT